MSDNKQQTDNDEVSGKDISIELSKLTFPFILAILIYLLFFA